MWGDYFFLDALDRITRDLAVGNVAGGRDAAVEAAAW
jgi:hypothetical protein